MKTYGQEQMSACLRTVGASRAHTHMFGIASMFFEQKCKTIIVDSHITYA